MRYITPLCGIDFCTPDSDTVYKSQVTARASIQPGSVIMPTAPDQLAEED